MVIISVIKPELSLVILEIKMLLWVRLMCIVIMFVFIIPINWVLRSIWRLVVLYLVNVVLLMRCLIVRLVNIELVKRYILILRFLNSVLLMGCPIE